MPCITVPTPPLPPPIPGGITITPPTPPVIPGVNLCCKTLLPPTPIPPFPIGALVTPAIVQAFNSAVKAARAYIDQLAIGDCPKN
jgi:hypothetical protein